LIQSKSENETSSSPDSKKLRVDFYESGRGDTIIVTFPDGGLGIIDAHPTSFGGRPDILELTRGRDVHFVCLTHPHADHGVDLVPILQNHSKIPEFWHTNSDITPFIFRLGEIPSWPSEVREFAVKMAEKWHSCMLDIFAAVAERDIPDHQMRAGEEIRIIAGVEIHVLAPEEKELRTFRRFWLEKADDPSVARPSPNPLSAILALRFGESVLLLGADAIGQNWRDAHERYRKLKLPKAKVLKVPHHGGSDALAIKGANYLDCCLHTIEERCKAVLLAGDSKHPNERVERQLKARTDLFCLGNGIRCHHVGKDLGIEIEGARPLGGIVPCQPVVSIELDSTGKTTMLAGHSCDNCQFGKTSSS
jgi:beta-lactamase superfamily II metal-dependent hydrolase